MAKPIRTAVMFAAGFGGFLVAMYVGYEVMMDRLGGTGSPEPSRTELNTALELRQSTNELISVLNEVSAFKASSESGRLVQFQQMSAPALHARVNAVRDRLMHTDVKHPTTADLIGCADRLTAVIQSPGDDGLHQSFLARMGGIASEINAYVVDVGATGKVQESVTMQR